MKTGASNGNPQTRTISRCKLAIITWTEHQHSARLLICLLKYRAHSFLRLPYPEEIHIHQFNILFLLFNIFAVFCSWRIVFNFTFVYHVIIFFYCFLYFQYDFIINIYSRFKVRFKTYSSINPSRCKAQRYPQDSLLGLLDLIRTPCADRFLFLVLFC